MQLVPSSYGSAELVEFNPCHEPAGSGRGGQFSTKGTGNCGPAGLLPEYTQTNPAEDIGRQPEGVAKTLRDGDVFDSEELGGGISTTLLTKVGDPDGDFVKAVFKPEVGERWTGNFSNYDIVRAINNREFSQAAREAAAYDLDQMLGTDLVPATVLREEVDGVDIPEAEGDDPDYAREQYDEWRERQLDYVGEDVAEQMRAQYQEDLQEFVGDARQAAEGVRDIWNEVLDEHPELEGNPYGDDIAKHPTLKDVGGVGTPPVVFDVTPRGTKVLDPMAVIVETGVIEDLGPGRSGARAYEGKVRDYLEDAILNKGYGELGDFDEVEAEDHFRSYEDWLDDHGETERRLIDERIQSFTDWADEQGYNLKGGGTNPEAPHPKGGSLQHFVKSTWSPMGDDEKSRFAVLDYALGSMDRHGHNFILTPDGAKAIDNGFSFPNRDATIRSVPVVDWLSSYGAKGVIADGTRQRLLSRLRNSDWRAFSERYPMNDDERSAFLERIDRLTSALQTPTGLKGLWRRTSLM